MTHVYLLFVRLWDCLYNLCLNSFIKMFLNVQKIKNYCRLCQENVGFVNIVDNEKFISKVYICSNIKLNDEQTRTFPNKVCNSCLTNVEQMFAFIQHIQTVNAKLHTYFTYLNSNNDKNLMHTIKKEDFCDEVINLKKETNLVKNCKKPKKNVNSKKNLNKCDLDEPVCDIPDRLHVPAGFLNNASKFDVPTDKTIENIDNNETAVDASAHQLDENDGNTNEQEVHVQSEEMKVKSKRMFPCTYDNCSKVCTSSYTFRTHLMKHEGKTPFLCVICGKGFRTKNSLNCHEKIHAKVKAYVCTECNIQFSVSSNLRAHQRKHHEGIRYYCSQCPLVYISKYSLERHELVHTGVKEYKCEMCTAAFYTNKELEKHQRYHQGLRRYKCEQCFKTFFEKHHLTIHIRGHTGERPYVCKINGCGKSFTESQKLTRHLKARHPLM
ncbi:hypothetical protein FQA39_LY06163 [Lamprigera yunnana]|nr:hypothetical protein FQA39_LY06163 [Lamprigera yunnana]